MIFNFGENEILISVRKMSRPVLGEGQEKAKFYKITPVILYKNRPKKFYFLVILTIANRLNIRIMSIVNK